MTFWGVFAAIQNTVRLLFGYVAHMQHLAAPAAPAHLRIRLYNPLKTETYPHCNQIPILYITEIIVCIHTETNLYMLLGN
jgi:hypothetical protein